MNIKYIVIFILIINMISSCIYSEAEQCEIDAWEEKGNMNPCSFGVFLILMDDGSLGNKIDVYSVQCIDYEMKLRKCRKKSNMIPAIPGL
jgi:hypothetical protein